MIRFEKNYEVFFEQIEKPLIIYGCGNAGEWIGHYLNRCNIKPYCFVDQKAIGETIMSYDKIGKIPVYNLDRFMTQNLGSMKIVIANHQVETVLKDICLFDQKNSADIICLEPYDIDTTEKETEKFNINHLLSYFRNKCIISEIPTIISNNCGAGFIYDLVGNEYLSPTISSVIMPDDYIKLCSDPKRYLDCDIVFSHWTMYHGKRQPVGRIDDDIMVYFIHDKDAEAAIERWNTLRTKVDYLNLFFLF